eukprot:43746-Eustigmatos_ZCMA.PRE.1
MAATVEGNTYVDVVCVHKGLKDCVIGEDRLSAFEPSHHQLPLSFVDTRHQDIRVQSMRYTETRLPTLCQWLDVV